MPRARSTDWHIAGWPAILLAPLLLPLALAIRIYVRLFGLKNTRDRSAREVAAYLQDFIKGSGRDWDWDDFTSIPITDPTLDSIRRRAELVLLPIRSDEGFDELRALLEEARTLQGKT